MAKLCMAWMACMASATSGPVSRWVWSTCRNRAPCVAIALPSSHQHHHRRRHRRPGHLRQSRLRVRGLGLRSRISWCPAARSAAARATSAPAFLRLAAPPSSGRRIRTRRLRTVLCIMVGRATSTLLRLRAPAAASARISRVAFIPPQTHRPPVTLATPCKMSGFRLVRG